MPGEIKPSQGMRYQVRDLRRGVTIACLKGFGKMPSLRDKLASFVNEGRRMSIHCFTVEFLHCTPVGSKPGSDMPNMAVPDLNKI